MQQVGQRAFVVHFQNLRSWSVAGLRELDWSWPKEYIKPLSTVLTKRSEVLESQTTETPPITIRFDGSVNARQTGTKRYKGRLFKAEAGDVVFSKIDLRNGAIGIVPDDLPIVAVTSEFPVYKVDSKRAQPEYIKLLVKSAVFRHYINGLVSGASGRKRITPEQLEQTEIPLPPLSIQRAIVERWQQGQQQAQALEEEGAKLEKNAPLEVRRLLGRIRVEREKPRSFIIPWSLLDKWGFDSVFNNQTVLEKPIYPEARIDEICSIGSGGTPSRQRRDYFSGSVPWVKTTEVRDEIIIETEEHLTTPKPLHKRTLSQRSWHNDGMRLAMLRNPVA